MRTGARHKGVPPSCAAGCCETSAIRHSYFCVPADAPELLKLATDGALDLSEAAPGARDGSPLAGLVVATWSAALKLAALMTGCRSCPARPACASDMIIGAHSPALSPTSFTL